MQGSFYHQAMLLKEYGKRVRVSTTCALSMPVSPYAMQYE